MIPSSAPQEVNKHEKQQGKGVPEKQAKTHSPKGPFQNKGRLRGRQAALPRGQSGTSVGVPGLDQRPFMTFVELLQTLKEGQSRFASFILQQEALKQGKRQRKSLKMSLLSIEFKVIWSHSACGVKMTLSPARVVHSPLLHTSPCLPSLHISITYAGV